MTLDNRFCFVAPMFNASKTVGQMLASIVGQSYKNWRLILIDDVSDSLELMNEIEIIERWHRLNQPGVELNDERSQIKVIVNNDKKWEMANVLHGISMCDDADVVCRIDADDWLTDLDALAYLNALYVQTGAEALWTAHRWAYTDKNISGPLPGDADPYEHPWVSSHLKTFRKGLINDINDENFRGEDGEYIKRTGDQALFLPILHKAKRRGFVPRVMYHYTIDDRPETYQTTDAKFQRDEGLFLRKRGFVK